MHAVQPVFDLNGGGFGNPNSSPSHCGSSLLLPNNMVIGKKYGNALAGLGGLYVPIILVRGLMESGYDTAVGQPDWNYIGWVPQGKIMVPLTIDFYLQFSASNQADIKDAVVTVRLYLIYPGTLDNDLFRIYLQSQSFPIDENVNVYRNGTFATHQTVDGNFPWSAITYHEDWTYDVTPKCTDVDGYFSGSSTADFGHFAVIKRFNVPWIPPNMGLGMHIGIHNYGSELLFPTLTYLYRRAVAFYQDADTQPIPLMGA